MRSEPSFVSQWGTAFQVWNNTASPADLITVLWCCMAELCLRADLQGSCLRAADLQNVNVEDLIWHSHVLHHMLCRWQLRVIHLIDSCVQAVYIICSVHSTA